MARSFRKILCPLELDEGAPAALQWAYRLAEKNATEIYLLHVLHLPEAVPACHDIYKDTQAAALAKLTELAREHLSGLGTRIETALGDPAEVIVSAARRLDPDVIVMATHRRRGLSRILLGSVAEAVLRQVDCPVLFLRAPSVLQSADFIDDHH
jgi:nucleotide-binding universal stress UspA family protein